MKAILGSTVLALGLGAASFTPAPALAQNPIVDIARVIVDVNDIVYRGGYPYYRYGSYGPNDRIIVVRENNRNVYYRNVPRGNAYGYYGRPPQSKYRNNGRYKNTRYYSRDRYDSDRRWSRDDDDRHDSDRYVDDRRGGRGR